MTSMVVRPNPLGTGQYVYMLGYRERISRTLAFTFDSGVVICLSFVLRNGKCQWAILLIFFLFTLPLRASRKLLAYQAAGAASPRAAQAAATALRSFSPSTVSSRTIGPPPPL